MLKATLLASIATIAIVASANAQLQPGPNISPSGRSFVYSPRAAMPYGSTGNGCMGFGKQWVAMVNQIADGMNVEGSTNFNNIIVARNQIDPWLELNSTRSGRSCIASINKLSECVTRFHLLFRRIGMSHSAI